jgi:hypothetical protein
LAMLISDSRREHCGLLFLVLADKGRAGALAPPKLLVDISRKSLVPF